MSPGAATCKLGPWASIELIYAGASSLRPKDNASQGCHRLSELIHVTHLEQCLTTVSPHSILFIFTPQQLLKLLRSTDVLVLGQKPKSSSALRLRQERGVMGFATGEVVRSPPNRRIPSDHHPTLGPKSSLPTTRRGSCGTRERKLLSGSGCRAGLLLTARAHTLPRGPAAPGR